jgi:3-phosphoshikimate 1-carboxyvinyltransferase
VATDEIDIVPRSKPFRAEVAVPGSKSITNRALILAAMAAGQSKIERALLSDDTHQMAAALRALGFEIELDAAREQITIAGHGGMIPASRAELDAGGAGTAMRFLTGLVTLGRGPYRIDGNARMRQRPVGALLDTLNALGVRARSEGDEGCPPIVIDTTAQAFAGGAATIDASLSSQFVSALLMPAALWPDGLRLTVIGETARPFIAMTLRLMETWGARSAVEGDTIIVPGGQEYLSRDFAVEPDASSASYFAAAAALIGGSVKITGLRQDSVQGDIGFLAILERMGAQVKWLADGVEVTSGGSLAGVDVAMNAMPDVVPTLAAIAPFAESLTRIRAVGFIRYHESDRISALVTELRRLGATVHEFDDGLAIEPSPLRPAAIETYDDHRIAMAFAIAGLKLPDIHIRNPGCVAKTYPAFFADLARLG